MSEKVQFRLDGDDYKTLADRSGGESPNIKAKEIFLDALYSQDRNVDYAVKISVRTLTLLQRLIAATIDEESAAKVISFAADDEQEILKKLGF